MFYGRTGRQSRPAGDPVQAGRGARMQNSIKRPLAVLALASGLCGSMPLSAQDSLAVPQVAPPAAEASVVDGAGPLMIHTKSASLRLIERGSRVVELPDNITHVTDFDPNVLTVDPISPTTVRVLALSPGVTSIVFTDVHGVSRTLEVFVSGDTRHLEAQLEYLFPDATIKAIQVGQNVVLRGFVTRPSQIAEIVDVATEFYPTVHNQLNVSTNDRVVLHTKVAEVNRSRLRQFGVNFLGFGTDAIFNNATGGIGPAQAFTGTLFALQEGTLANPNLNFAFRTSAGEYGLFVEALKQEAILRILAEPSVTVMSGRPGTLLSGGEFPILVPQGLGQTAIEFREFGVSIEAVAVVLGDGRVRLDISPEVSDLDFTNGVTLDGIRIPGLTTRRVNTQAEMKFGETLVLGGLISKRRIGSTTKVPFLGELPVVGAAFSRKRYEDAETELLVMVTPMPAAPYQPGECPPPAPGESSSDPTDKELYWHGHLELPKYGERCGDGSCNSCNQLIGPAVAGPPQMSQPAYGHGAGPMMAPQMDGPTFTTGEPYAPLPADAMLPGGSAKSEVQQPSVETPTMTQPVIEQIPVQQVSFRKEAAVATPSVSQPTAVTTPATPSLKSRFNPFARRAERDALNAPKPSGPAMPQAGLTQPTSSRAATSSSQSPAPSRPASGLIQPTNY